MVRLRYWAAVVFCLYFNNQPDCSALYTPLLAGSTHLPDGVTPEARVIGVLPLVQCVSATALT